MLSKGPQGSFCLFGLLCKQLCPPFLLLLIFGQPLEATPFIHALLALPLILLELGWWQGALAMATALEGWLCWFPNIFIAARRRLHAFAPFPSLATPFLTIDISRSSGLNRRCSSGPTVASQGKTSMAGQLLFFVFMYRFEAKGVQLAKGTEPPPRS